MPAGVILAVSVSEMDTNELIDIKESSRGVGICKWMKEESGRVLDKRWEIGLWGIKCKFVHSWVSMMWSVKDRSVTRRRCFIRSSDTLKSIGPPIKITHTWKQRLLPEPSYSDGKQGRCHNYQMGKPSQLIIVAVIFKLLYIFLVYVSPWYISHFIDLLPWSEEISGDTEAGSLTYSIVGIVKGLIKLVNSI